MRDRGEDLERLGAAVLVVSFGPADAIDEYRRRLELPFEVAADPSRRAYRDYGLTRGSAWKIWHPRVIARYAVLMLKGMKPELPREGEDLAQLGGDFVIGPGGELRFIHRSERPDDRPPVDRLLAALAS